MEVVITESAADDLGDGHDFYEETEFGLGDKFVTSIMSDLRSLPM